MSLTFFVAEILSFIPMEFVALQVCAELVLRVICTVDPSSVPTIDLCIPRAKHPPLHLEHFLRWINNRIDRLVDDLAPWITVKRRHTATKQRSARSFDMGQKHYFRWRFIRAEESVLWWRNYLFSKWNDSFLGVCRATPDATANTVPGGPRDTMRASLHCLR
jgi:hypothetical protein